MPPVITFLTDFGPAAPAVCRGVMLGICPDAAIIDITHDVPRYSIRDGSGSLVFALPYMPIGIHVAVVDPGVGTDRRPIGLRVARGDLLIGPDNGLLTDAAEILGGVVEARALENRDLMLPEVSATFHGRDLFAPIAGHLACGAPFETVGPEIAIDELVRLPAIRSVVGDGFIETVIIRVMVFGNVTFAGGPSDLEVALGPLEPGAPIAVEFLGDDGDPPTLREQTTWQRTFGEVPHGASLLYADSEGQLSLADNQGDIAARLGLATGRRVRIRRAPDDQGAHRGVSSSGSST